MVDYGSSRPLTLSRVQFHLKKFVPIHFLFIKKIRLDPEIAHAIPSLSAKSIYCSQN